MAPSCVVRLQDDDEGELKIALRKLARYLGTLGRDDHTVDRSDDAENAVGFL